jgi:pyruvate dehydrogenase E1 component alpha subunit
VFAVHKAATEARARALSGDGPTFIESQTYRYSGHGSGEGVGAYRNADEVADWKQSRDPIARCAQRLTELGLLDDADLEELDKGAKGTVDAAVQFAEESPWPAPL